MATMTFCWVMICNTSIMLYKHFSFACVCHTADECYRYWQHFSDLIRTSYSKKVLTKSVRYLYVNFAKKSPSNAKLLLKKFSCPNCLVASVNLRYGHSQPPRANFFFGPTCTKLGLCEHFAVPFIVAPALPLAYSLGGNLQDSITKASRLAPNQYDACTYFHCTLCVPAHHVL